MKIELELNDCELEGNKFEVIIEKDMFIFSNGGTMSFGISIKDMRELVDMHAAFMPAFRRLENVGS